jgi:hypothetical protein
MFLFIPGGVTDVRTTRSRTTDSTGPVLSPSTILNWERLPPEVRRKVVTLLAWMLSPRRPTPSRSVPTGRWAMSDKIQPQHLQRKAVLYVCQSSGYQVTHNLESQRLQYGVEQRLRSLGWQETEIIDEGLGRSTAGDTRRAGNPLNVNDVHYFRSFKILDVAT